MIKCDYQGGFEYDESNQYDALKERNVTVPIIVCGSLSPPLTARKRTAVG